MMVMILLMMVEILEGGEGEDHAEIKKEIQEDKAKFLKERDELQNEKKEAQRDSARQRAEMESHDYILQSDGEPSSAQATERRNKIREMMMHAWTGYEKYAWGANELKPIAHTGHSASIFGKSAMGATIVDGMDTLYIMGLHDQYEKARNWIAHEFNFNPTSDISVFEVNIRYIGGLISMYALTKDEMFKNKAAEIAEKLMPAFNTPTGIPFGLINARTGTGRNWGWASGGCSILSEFGSLHLEFSYLSDITGDSKYLDKVQKVRSILKSTEKIDGLYPNYLHPKTGKWGQKHVSLGALGDSYYEYLLKSFILTGGSDTQALEMYREAIEAMERKMKQTSNSGLVFFGDFRGAKVEKKMDHLSCFSGGMFALGSKYINNPEHYLELGAQITETCHKSYENSATKLGPEAFRFEGHGEAVAMRQNEKYYILRPETIESYFVMWRLTKDQKYRDWGWQAVEAIEKNCRVDAGFSGVKDVYASRVVHDDVQQSFFLAETLKYLYLLYSDEDFISLDEWVFNTEAHPLPIRKNLR
ncbi:putative mannosyl-oligosaccharide 1,2-alpha-mannosidase IB-like [Apostichopus japonicus]|uniref:alpha-1,2-Mannosidase n=1 Tax=Stichopus japonicus TaxID=307972 RepID=A0A2G8JUF9_STIJA|nr:putative mannosyl-oligosaccharide 1,2-alpha-mannosidase IB-like [Apostichopus japonicus]